MMQHRKSDGSQVIQKSKTRVTPNDKNIIGRADTERDLLGTDPGDD